MRRSLAGLALMLVTTAAVPAAASAAPGFTAPIDLAAPSSRPVMTPDGTVVVGVSPYINGHFRTGVQVRPPGGAFSAAKQLDAGGDNSAPSLAAAADGRVVAVWVEGADVHVATLMPGAADFTNTATLTDDTATGAVVDTDAAGNATVLWSTQDGPSTGTNYVRFRATRVPADGSAPTTQLLEEAGPTANVYHTPYSLLLDVNAGGDAIAMWSRAEGNNAATTTAYSISAAIRPAGQAFGSRIAIDSSLNHYTSQAGDTYVSPFAVSVNDSGELGVLWNKSYYATFNDIFYRAGTVSGGLSATTEDVDQHTPGGYEKDAQLVIDPDGRAIVAINAISNGHYRLESVFRPRGGAFADSIRVQDVDEEDSAPSLVTNASGDVLVAWPTYPTASGNVYAAVAHRGTTFGTPFPVAKGIPSLQGPYAALGATGDGVLTWSYDGGGIVQSARAVGYDATPPTLRNISVPGALNVGDSGSFTADAADIWGPVTTSWMFGDGAGADGNAVSHAYAAAGDLSATVTATDAVGNSVSATRPVSVAAPAQPVVKPGADTTAPLVSGFAASPSVFAVGSKSTALAAKVARGTKFSFSLSEAGSVAITIAKQIPGRRSGSRCVPATKKLRKKKACTAFKTSGTLRRSGTLGQNSVAFSGKLGRRALGVGRYRATIVATDAAGNRSAAKSASFRIVPAR